MNVDLRNGLEYLVWVDIETSGVKPHDQLLEIGAAITTFGPDFSVIGDPFARVVALGELQIRHVDRAVLTMHCVNGLWEASRKSTVGAPEALREMQLWFRSNAPEGATFLWAGRSVHFDLNWLVDPEQPSLETERKFSHRRFDLRPIMAFLSLAGFEVPSAEENHRACQDVMGDIEMARDLARRLMAARSR